ncbi:hypothetical protein CYPRO_2880 [Cyclonatronum proteinivorum]|uniref:Erythromycin esterase n=1 Tax=Cyclonatronum proteinivorum TaxID=1457365 RepID=A0A345UNR6_9BACT|nr:hypothetical protein [Cyclonatronum proteinivorum]AXJ02118.1 hypothetical protein CYPRO_2880 [Cyclonatronum proteinivorum]
MIFTITFALLFLPQVHADQPPDPLPFSENLFAAHTTYFEIRDGEIVGADALLAALTQAHFVALGELHNRKHLGELATSLLRFLAPHGFAHFAVETGPYAAQKLQALIGEGRSDVLDFYAGYASRVFDLIPIPFFKGETDLDFLEAAHAFHFTLWGLDQEFYFSYKFLIDELLRLGGEEVSPGQQRMHRTLSRRLYWLDRRNQVADLFGGNFQRSCRLQDDDTFQAFLDSFAGFGHPDIQLIREALHKTLEIYCLNERGGDSDPVRVTYFKENFDRNFKAALAENPQPKVFLKMGSWHMGRHESPRGLQDIGHHVAQLAESRNQESVHIRYHNRFLEGGDVLERSGWEGLERLLSVGVRDQWALIDIRPIRALFEDGQLTGTASASELRTIRNWDFVIIAPEDHGVSPHW